jgi:xanthine dehydrogenase accessory factor
MAKARLRQQEPLTEVRHQVHDKQASTDQSGMICSGEQTIFLYSIQEQDQQAIQSIIDCLQQLQNGSLQLSPQGIAFSPSLPANDFFFEQTTEQDWQYSERLGYRNHLYIIGGGHCALALSKLMVMLDFYIHLYDTRDNLNTFVQNTAAHEKTILPDYTALAGMITGGDHQYVVIMTFGYRTDYIAAKALLGKPYRYMGIMGSKKKIETLFSDFTAEGISPTLLQQVHAPIGISIKSETPEEIAVSIAAEIIAVKNR